MSETDQNDLRKTKFGEGAWIDPVQAKEIWQKIEAQSEANGEKPPQLPLPKSWEGLTKQMPTELIKGVFYAGTKMGVAAGSKSLKTWLLMHLAYCVSNGIDFMGYPTTKALVGYFDFELPEFALRQRFGLIRSRFGGKGNFDNIKIWPLRGKVKMFTESRAKFPELLTIHGIEVAIIDPIYKFLLGKNENDNSMVAGLLEEFAQYCTQTGAAIIYTHHHSKGNQSEKNAIDRTSGAGTWGRDPDTLLDLTEHEDSLDGELILTAEFITRLFERPQKFVVRWDFPLLVRDGEGLNPENLKAPKRLGRPKKDIADEILVILRLKDSEGGLSAQELADSILCPLRTVYRYLKDLMPAKVVKAPQSGGFQLSLAERSRVEEFKNHPKNI